MSVVAAVGTKWMRASKAYQAANVVANTLLWLLILALVLFLAGERQYTTHC